MSKKASPTRTTNPLPFADLEPHRFEDLVRNLIYDFRTWRSIEATGRGGSDDGFDVRAREETSSISNRDQEDDEPGTHPMEGNLWKVQCKREKELGPARVKSIVNEGVDKNDPPYGYVLVAPANFSRQSYDAFRNELHRKGVMEFYLWGKAELEDMLFLPKNDSILFAFFGISLVTRKRSRASELKFSINNKNKLLRILGDGDARREFHSPILARDLKDSHYPWESRYEDFDRLPRWKEFNAIEFHPLGLIVEVAKRFAIVDTQRKEWDFVSTVNLLFRQSDDAAKREDNHKKEQTIRNFWDYMPRVKKAYLIVNGLILFEDMLVIDEKGDSLYPFPHIFVDFSKERGPFNFFLESLTVGRRQIQLDSEYKEVKFFPAVFPPARKRNIRRDHVLEFDPRVVRELMSDYFDNKLFDVTGKYAYLNQRDVIRVKGAGESVRDEETFIEITHKYQTAAKEYVSEHPEQRALIEFQIGQELKDSDAVTVLEFERVSSWQLKDD